MKKIFKTLLRVIGLTAIGVVGLVILVITALYLPPVQDYVKDYALREVKKSTGMDIVAETFRLRPPLRLELGGISVVEQSGDTLASLGHARVNLMLLPLVSGSAEVEDIDLEDLYYRMGTPDSAMYLTARVDTVALADASYSFKRSVIDLRGPVVLAGGRVDLLMNDSVETPVDTSASNPLDLLILARDLQLRRVTYSMRMLPVIDSLGAYVLSARLTGGRLDMASQHIHARSLAIDSVAAEYIYPAVTATAATADTAASSSSSAPWTVMADHVSLTATHALYALAGAHPIPGLDMNYLAVADVDIEVDSLYNRATAVRVPLRRLLATERCGLSLNAAGLFEMDSTTMRADGFRISTGRSILNFEALMGMGDMKSDSSLPLALDARAEIAPSDIATAFPALAPMIKPLSQSPVRLVARASGTTGRIDIDTLSAAIPDIAALRADGSVSNPFDFDHMDGHMTLDGSISRGADRLKSIFLDRATAASINIAPTRLKGDIDYKPGRVDGTLSAITGAGRMNLGARWAMTAESYNASLRLDRFPVQAFMPGVGVRDVTATLNASGHGYNPLRPSTSMDVDLRLVELTFNDRQLSNIILSAQLSNGRAHGSLVSANEDAELDADFDATLTPQGYTWDVTGDIHNLDLMAMGLSATPMGGSLSLATNGRMTAGMKSIDALVDVADLDWRMGADRIDADSIHLSLASDSVTLASLTSGDMALRLNARSPLMTIVDRLSGVPVLIDSAIALKKVDVIALQHTLPPIDAHLMAGRHNFASDYMARTSKTSWDSLTFTLRNDSLIHMRSRVLGLRVGANRLDTIAFDANQKGKHLVFSASMNERPGSMDNFAHVSLTGFIADDRLSMLVRQSNIKGERGFNIGMNVVAADSAITIRFVPRKPTIGYKQWAINPDNFVTYDFARKFVSANLALEGEDSSLKLYTLNETAAADQEDIALELSKIHLQDWLSISPFAPPIKGDLGANLRFHLANEQLTGRGVASLANLYYGRDRVGSFDLDLDVASSRGGVLTADVGLMVDSVKVITATGALNDSTRNNPFLLDFSMIRFPLSVANPFLPKEYARLAGTLSGHMDITGSMAEPIFNGNIAFDSATVKVGMLGQTFGFAPDSIPVDSNVVRFDRFRITGANSNPLTISGLVDMRHISEPAFDLSMQARDMQILNSSRPRGADAYGKAFIDLDASVKGNMQFVNVDADLAVLAGTNVTYIMTDAESKIVNRSTGDMVQFVVFADSGAVARADSVVSGAMNINLEARLNIEQGSTISVDLSTDGKNKVQIKGEGRLDYTQNPMNDGRLTGRFNINSGFVRYTPPFMSEKLFDFEEGSYVSFNGDMMNPILNVHANDRLRANVTRSGEDSRLVNFDIALGVTGTLNQMNVAFDLSTNDDITVQNELQGMTPEQRANQAMNLLLYNVYTGSGTHATANLAGNPLYSFLSSQLNSWMANNVKGVDISFGIDQYDKTAGGNTSTATSYSYRVSKSLFNDRFKIVVGGNYSTDADADENFSQNLISDISFEYMLNRAGSMYVRIFRHTGYESILEGEITQTGVGFVVKRKLNTLRNLFRFLPGVKPKTIEAPAAPSSSDSNTPAK